MVKILKLVVHQKNFSGEDLIINPKDFPSVKKGDIVEVYHQEDEFSRLLLQVTSFKEDLQGKETISVEQSIANTFQLRTYADVYVNIVNPEDVILDSVELTFKDQYMGRSDMWRLKNSLINTCVYLNKKIEFCSGNIRCQVYEMWAQGDRVACGVITEDTKIVFRSSTSMVYLFIQMSSEMWDFDIHGDLYFEKAVNGFLADLFHKWKKNGSNHEVTIVLFSRTFYKASTLEEFPGHMRECLQQDYKGRFYEDFYRVAVQNERYDDWTNTLVQLRRLFTDYQTKVLEHHKRPGAKIPKAINSTAAQGNFLEVLNMSLNVFEKHYLDRSFDRTGQLSVVITPGVGVFEVDRELTNVTKQRIIDNGVGSDLVCVGEQPLHAVPLLKFHNKDTSITAVDDYSMPHWINLSFYSTNKKVGYSTFIPRIKLPPKRTKPSKFLSGDLSRAKLLKEEERLPNSLFDYDAYDAQVFQLPPVHAACFSHIVQPPSCQKRIILPDVCSQKQLKRKLSDPDIHHLFNDYGRSVSSAAPKSSAIAIPYRAAEEVSQLSSFKALNIEVKQKAFISKNECMELEISPPPQRSVVGSAGSSGDPSQLQQIAARPGRALINPFDPSHVTIKLTSNRRRWTHIFPKGPTGVLIQQHHYQAVPTHSTSDQGSESTYSSSPGHDTILQNVGTIRTVVQSGFPGLLSGGRYSSDIQTNEKLPVNKRHTLLWGATGEQEWTPALTTGVDWKSLTIPACLPITTDYFPDKRSLQNDYVVSDYNLLPDDVNADYAQQRAVYKKPLTTGEVFRELVSQRLAQGFQWIVLQKPKKQESQVLELTTSQPQSGLTSLVRSRPKDSEPNEQYLLSIGRIFHKITLNGSAITVTRYRPRHPYPPFNIHYRYKFQAPDHDTYEVSWVSFTTEKLENYNWNYLDHYICTRGDSDFALVPNLKYWRFRMYFLPLNHQGTKKILDGSKHCDVYALFSTEEKCAMVDGFLKFIETWVNKIRRTSSHKKPREKFVLNRMADWHVSRSGSKVMERVKMEGSSSGRGSPASEATGEIKGTPSSHEVPLDGGHQENAEDSQGTTDPFLVKKDATLPEILEAMRNPTSGVNFFMQHPSLPSFTFASADAVMWLLAHVEGVTKEAEAVSIMQNLLTEKLICHASGEFSHPFVLGFYLYHIVLQEKEMNKDGDYSLPLGDAASFENEWVEVDVKHPTGWIMGSEAPSQATIIPEFLQDELALCKEEERELNRRVPRYKHTHLEIDVNAKSDRIEWGHTRYQSMFQSDEAYEFTVQWVAATGVIMAELIMGWARKSQTCGIQLIPIPSDPFALPFTVKSDPLRGPVFVPLDIECLKETKQHLFEEFPEESWGQRLFLFQEAIVGRFGFLPCLIESSPTHSSFGQAPGSKSSTSHHHQYVHVTGNSFIMIPSEPCPHHSGTPSTARSQAIGIKPPAEGRRYSVHTEVIPSPHEEYITRHVSGKYREDYQEEKRTGFLWSWNHMLSKRWKTSSTTATGDENFQNKLIKDFKEFCANCDNRLQGFWESCLSAKYEQL